MNERGPSKGRVGVRSIRITTGIVVQGGSEVPDKDLVEGTDVTFLMPEEAEPFTLNAEAEAALLYSLEELDRGEFVPEAEILATL